MFGTSLMLFTARSVLAGEGTLIIKASHKGKQQCWILMLGPVGSEWTVNAATRDVAVDFIQKLKDLSV